MRKAIWPGSQSSGCEIDVIYLVKVYIFFFWGGRTIKSVAKFTQLVVNYLGLLSN